MFYLIYGLKYIIKETFKKTNTILRLDNSLIKELILGI